MDPEDNAQTPLASRFLQWGRTPLTTRLDPETIVLTTLLTVTVAFFWNRILGYFAD